MQGWQKNMPFQALQQLQFFCHPVHFQCEVEITNKTPQLSAPRSHDFDNLRVWNFQEIENTVRRWRAKIFRILALGFFIEPVPRAKGAKFPFFKRAPFHRRLSLRVQSVLKMKLLRQAFQWWKPHVAISFLSITVTIFSSLRAHPNRKADNFSQSTLFRYALFSIVILLSIFW